MLETLKIHSCLFGFNTSTFLFLAQAYFMLDELLLGGDIQETSKKNVLKAIAAQDLLQEEETPQGFFEDHGLG